MTFVLLASMLGSSSGRADPTDFASKEIAAAAARCHRAAPVVAFELDPSLGAQAYRIIVKMDRIIIQGGDSVGAMYGGLDLAEALELGRPPGSAGAEVHRPHILNRGIKFNLPLDLRTPSYSDCSDAAQANIPEMWSMEFWHTFLDEMARDRYNVLTLWSEHIFPSLVKVPEFPEVALNDVWRTKAKLDDNFELTGTDMVKPAMLADHEVVKTITIEEKIAFWNEVMRYAQERGVAVYLFTWNVFTWGATGRYGITDEMTNPTTVAYTRASVREMVKTYPLLAGIGITAGEHMPGNGAAREKWLWDTYGEGVRDALKDQPGRVFPLIRRFLQRDSSIILSTWKNYPGPFQFSLKYSSAHMYTIPHPPSDLSGYEYVPEGIKTWLTVRNDDIYTFRFGDPDFAREYLLNMPPADRLVGFYMGPDGYTWGREFLERDPGPGPRALVLQKQWYSFLLWGRLSYDPSLSDAHFVRVLGARFPGAEANDVFAALQNASQTMPLITRFFWRNFDFKWFPEACLSHRKTNGFCTVRHFIDGVAMPGSGVLDIRTWRKNLREQHPMGGTTPLQIADSLHGYARETLSRVEILRQGAPGAGDPKSELAKTLADCEALAWLGRYYAAKIRGACALALYDTQADPGDQADAVRELQTALVAWKRYAGLRDAHYVPALFNRVGEVDCVALTDKVSADIDIARSWKPASGNTAQKQVE